MGGKIKVLSQFFKLSPSQIEFNLFVQTKVGYWNNLNMVLFQRKQQIAYVSRYLYWLWRYGRFLKTC